MLSNGSCSATRPPCSTMYRKTAVERERGAAHNAIRPGLVDDESPAAVIGTPPPAVDPACLAASLAELVGHPAYGLDDLRGDLERFVFLPGSSDGEHLFGPQSPSPPRRKVPAKPNPAPKACDDDRRE